jgi:hypothetical protein
MSDNLSVDPGTSLSAVQVAADDVGGVIYQRVKTAWGVDGAAVDTSKTNPFPVGLQDGAIVSATLSATGDLVVSPSLGDGGYTSAAFQFTYSGAAGITITFKATVDGTNWVAIAATAVANAGSVESTTTTQASPGIFTVDGIFKFVKAEVTAYGSGSVTGTGIFKTGGVAKTRGVFATLSATSFGGVFGATTTQSGGGIALTSHLPSSANTTNATVAKASAGRLYAIDCYNTNAAVRFIHIYNKATTPSVGTDVPILTFALPPAGRFSKEWSNIGYYFSTGISFGLSTGAADNDSAAVAAGDIVGLELNYA